MSQISVCAVINLFFIFTVGVFGQSATKYESFIGIGYTSGATRTLTARNPWTTKGQFANDCRSGVCQVATACKDNTKVVFENNLTSECPSKTQCFRLTMYQRPPDIGPIVYNIDCRLNWPATVYREVEGLTLGQPMSSNSDAANSQPTSPVSSDLSPPESAAQNSQSSPAPSPSDSSSSSSTQSTSKAWIAGAVVGPIAGLAMIGGAILFLLRRRRNKKQVEDDVHEIGPSEQPAVEKYSQNEKSMQGVDSRRPAELAPENAPAELPAERI